MKTIRTSNLLDVVEHDGMVGQLLDKLKELGLEENTIRKSAASASIKRWKP